MNTEQLLDPLPSSASSSSSRSSRSSSSRAGSASGAGGRADAGREGRPHGDARGLAPGADGVPARDHDGHGLRRSTRGVARAAGGERDRHDLSARGVPAAAGRGQTRELLREYAPLRVTPPTHHLAGELARSTELQTELWAIAEELARTTPDSQVLAIYIESLNDMIDLQETRVDRDRLRARAGDRGAAAHRRRCVDPWHGRLQRGADAPARLLIADGAGHRAERRHHPRRRPRPTPRGLPPGEPAAAHRPPAADRPTVAGVPLHGAGIMVHAPGTIAAGSDPTSGEGSVHFFLQRAGFAAPPRRGPARRQYSASAIRLGGGVGSRRRTRSGRSMSDWR